MGEQPSISPNDATNLGKAEEGSSNEQTKRKIVLDLDPGTEADIHLKWQTNEKLPLQIVQRSQSAYSNWKLYQGLPVTLVMQIPVTLQPTLTVDVLEKDPSSIEKTFPGGPVFDEIQIDLEATKRDWIWIGAKQKK